jgi:hypothetical protein
MSTTPEGCLSFVTLIYCWRWLHCRSTICFPRLGLHIIDSFFGWIEITIKPPTMANNILHEIK